MKKQMKRVILPIFLVTTLVVTGCHNVLYDSSRRAPVYPGTQAKRHGVFEPALVNSTLTPVPANNAVMTPSIEQPSDITVTNNNSYPTSVYQPTVKIEPLPEKIVARPSTIARQPISVAPQPAVTGTSKPFTSIENPATASMNNTVQNTLTSSTTPRVKTANDVLHQQAAVSANQMTTNQPAGAVDTSISKTTTALTQPVVNATNTVNSTAAKATQEIEKVTTTVNNTVNTSAATAKEAVSNATKPIRTTPKTTPSATTALLQEARNAVATGKYDKAASALERAHRIEPGNAKILYDIAQIRYAQGKYSQAESFASKAASLSKSPSLSKKTWMLLSNSRKALGNNIGAKTAARKAASF